MKRASYLKIVASIVVFLTLAAPWGNCEEEGRNDEDPDLNVLMEIKSSRLNEMESFNALIAMYNHDDPIKLSKAAQAVLRDLLMDRRYMVRWQAAVLVGETGDPEGYFLNNLLALATQELPRVDAEKELEEAEEKGGGYVLRYLEEKLGIKNIGFLSEVPEEYYSTRAKAIQSSAHAIYALGDTSDSPARTNLIMGLYFKVAPEVRRDILPTLLKRAPTEFTMDETVKLSKDNASGQHSAFLRLYVAKCLSYYTERSIFDGHALNSITDMDLSTLDVGQKDAQRVLEKRRQYLAQAQSNKSKKESANTNSDSNQTEPSKSNQQVQADEKAHSTKETPTAK